MSFLGRQFMIFFELYLDHVYQDRCTSIIHLTSGGNHNNYGDRTPAVFYGKDGLVVASAIDGESNYVSSKKTLEAGRWYKFHISQLLIKDQVTIICVIFLASIFASPPSHEE